MIQFSIICSLNIKTFLFDLMIGLDQMLPLRDRVLLGNNGNKGALSIHQSSIITGVLQSECLVY